MSWKTLIMQMIYWTARPPTPRHAEYDQCLGNYSREPALKINIKKTKHLRSSSRSNEPILVNREVINEVDYFTYLGSKVSTSEMKKKRSQSGSDRFQRQARPLPRFEALGNPRTSARRQRSVSSKVMS